MSDELDQRQIELKVHGLTTEDHGRVPARVFATKLGQLVGVLEAADKSANGKIVHTYVLASMHTSVPTAILTEVPLPDASAAMVSAIPIVSDAIEGIKAQDLRVERLSDVVGKIRLLASGAEGKFGFAELRTAGEKIVRIDDFLHRRALQHKNSKNEKWFNGIVIGSFDGKLKYVDARGAVPQIKLVLSAGGKEIDCVCRREDIGTLGDQLDQRVRVYGRAIYTGSSPLPMRVEVTSIAPVKRGVDITSWRGVLTPFEIESWDLSS